MNCASRFVLILVLVTVALSAVAAFSPTPSRTVSLTIRSPPRRNTAFWGVAPLQVWRDAVKMMPETLLEKQKELVRSPAGPAILERPETAVRRERVEEPRKEKKGMGSEAWEVRIYNDGLNTREHVSRSLVQVCGLSERGAYETMMQAHLNGIAVVGRYLYEVAEMYHDALKKNGIVCDIVPVDED